MPENRRDLFLETGKTARAIQDKIETAFVSLFEGDPETERVCFQASPEETYIVDTGHQDIRSEGMSYGMTIAALLGKRDLFNSLWNFAKKYMQHQQGPQEGYFSWQLRCSDFSMMDPGAAPDGEEYFAASLIFAAERFQCDTYRAEAVRILRAMAHKAPGEGIEPIMDRRNGLVRFSPVAGNDFTDPSYHTPAFYRLFATVADEIYWKETAGKSLQFLKRALHPETGLAPDYAEFNGSPKATDWCPMSDCFSGDAWRVAMNLGLDYVYFTKDPWERTICEKRLRFFNARRPYQADYRIDGSSYPQQPRKATPGLIAMNACAALVLPSGHSLLTPFAEDLWNLHVPTGKWRYYDGLLYMLALLACSGRFFPYFSHAGGTPGLGAGHDSASRL